VTDLKRLLLVKLELLAFFYEDKVGFLDDGDVAADDVYFGIGE
jgi:hypothetical protein